MQGIQQRNLSALAIAEYNDLLKLYNPVPHILQKCETIAAVWNADRIAYSGLGHRQAVNLSFRYNQSPKIYALRHAKQDRLCVFLAPLLVLVPGFIKIRPAIF